MGALADKLRRAREFRVPVEKFTFIMRRPTDVEWMEMSGPKVRAILPYIIGWEGVTEMDLIPGGDPHPLPFDREACEEWVTDRIDLLPPLVEAFVKAYEEHVEKRSQAEKN